jgi:hypothetical protein
MTRKFFKTTYTVVVLSEDTPATNLPLEQLAYAITDGDCSGKVSDDGGVLLTGPQAAAALIEQSSDPSFFRLTVDGEDMDAED